MTTRRHWDVLLARNATTATPPLDLDSDGVLTLAPASDAAAGSMSAEHFGLLDGAEPGDVDAIAAAASKALILDGNADSSVRVVKASMRVEVGTTVDGKAILQIATPTAEGQIQVDPTTGRITLYVDGAAVDPVLRTEVPPIIWARHEADALGTDVIDEFTFFFGMPMDITITSIVLRPNAALVANDANYAGIGVSRRAASGGGSTLIASATTQITGGTGDWTAFEPVPLGLVASGALPAGHQLTLRTEKDGSKVLPAFAIAVFFTID